MPCRRSPNLNPKRKTHEQTVAIDFDACWAYRRCLGTDPVVGSAP